MERREFQVGERVRLSEIGRKTSKKPERQGHIVARGRTRATWHVLWNGLRLAQLIHWTHLERAEDQEPG
jgi:hypothetical protein